MSEDLKKAAESSSVFTPAGKPETAPPKARIVPTRKIAGFETSRDAVMVVLEMREPMTFPVSETAVAAGVSTIFNANEPVAFTFPPAQLPFVLDIFEKVLAEYRKRGIVPAEDQQQIRAPQMLGVGVLNEATCVIAFDAGQRTAVSVALNHRDMLMLARLADAQVRQKMPPAEYEALKGEVALAAAKAMAPPLIIPGKLS